MNLTLSSNCVVVFVGGGLGNSSGPPPPPSLVTCLGSGLPVPKDAVVVVVVVIVDEDEDFVVVVDEVEGMFLKGQKILRNVHHQISCIGMEQIGTDSNYKLKMSTW